ncbi:hypothetical protein SUGI_0821650 [Cryptomeria japonica]|nr:hypothetical protein SUGI_0821650 [Cryptomeria japonica]
MVEEVAASRGRATEQGTWWRMSSNLLLSHGRQGGSVESALNLCLIWSHRQNINYLGAVQPTFTLNFSKASKPFPPHNTFGRPGAKRVAVYLGSPSRDDVYFHRIPDHTDQSCGSVKGGFCKQKNEALSEMGRKDQRPLALPLRNGKKVQRAKRLASSFGSAHNRDDHGCGEEDVVARAIINLDADATKKVFENEKYFAKRGLIGRFQGFWPNLGDLYKWILET